MVCGFAVSISQNFATGPIDSLCPYGEAYPYGGSNGCPEPAESIHMYASIRIPRVGNWGSGPYSWKITNLSSQKSVPSHHRHASETQFKWRFTGEPIMARLYHIYWVPLSYLLGTCLHID